jgi:hypothetical protein
VADKNFVTVQANYRRWQPELLLCTPEVYKVANRKSDIVLVKCTVWQPKIAPFCRRNIEGGTEKISAMCSRSVEGFTKNAASIYTKIVEGGSQKIESVCRRILDGCSQILRLCAGVVPSVPTKYCVSLQANCRGLHPKIRVSVQVKCGVWQPKIASVFRRNIEVGTRNW